MKGKDFRHEKTKRKRGSYRCGKITMGTASTALKYSSEEDESEYEEDMTFKGASFRD